MTSNYSKYFGCNHGYTQRQSRRHGRSWWASPPK